MFSSRYLSDLVIMWVRCIKEFGFYSGVALETRSIIFGYVSALNDTESISNELFEEVLKCIGYCQTEDEWKVG